MDNSENIAIPYALYERLIDIRNTAQDMMAEIKMGPSHDVEERLNCPFLSKLDALLKD